MRRGGGADTTAPGLDASIPAAASPCTASKNVMSTGRPFSRTTKSEGARPVMGRPRPIDHRNVEADHAHVGPELGHRALRHGGGDGCGGGERGHQHGGLLREPNGAPGRGPGDRCRVNSPLNVSTSTQTARARAGGGDRCGLMQPLRPVRRSRPAPRRRPRRPSRPPSPTRCAAPAPHRRGWSGSPGGEFSMGAQDPRGHAARRPRPDAGRAAHPPRRTSTASGWTQTEVTNEQFARFVKATGYVTVAERKPTRRGLSRRAAENLVAGLGRLHAARQAVPLDDHYHWWSYVPGANWRHPDGPTERPRGRDSIPSSTSPTRTPWPTRTGRASACPPRPSGSSPRAAVSTGKLYAWGDELQARRAVDGEHATRATFPVQRHGRGRLRRHRAGRAVPAERLRPVRRGGQRVGVGAATGIARTTTRTLAATGGVARNPQGPDDAFDPASPAAKKRVHRGGSFLCTDQYCTRYMVGTRGKGEVTSAATTSASAACGRPLAPRRRAPGGPDEPRRPARRSPPPRGWRPASARPPETPAPRPGRRSRTRRAAPPP